MPVVISQEDLSELMRSDEELDHAMDAVERALLERHAGGAGHAIFADLPLANGNAFKVMGCSADGPIATLRVFPGQTNEGARKDTAFVIALDPATGGLRALVAGDELNALRTSVPAGVGARHLAQPGARVLAVLGSGAQARGHARVITRAAQHIEEVRVWSPTKTHREAFAEEQTVELGIAVHPCATAEEAIVGADVLTAAGRTTGGTPAYEASWVKPGALAISMTSSAPAALRQRARFVVSTQNRPTLVAFGFVGRSAPRPGVDLDGAVQLADIIAGREQARADAKQPVVFELGNVYLWDQPTLAFLP